MSYRAIDTERKVELSSNLGCSSKSSPLIRVILAKKLNLRIEKRKSYLKELFIRSLFSATPRQKTYLPRNF